ALAALMCFHAARLPARVDALGNLSSLFDQDRSRWDAQLVAEGQKLLDLSATGPEITEYHIEAAIAWVHAVAQHAEDTDWERIVSLYDTLMTIRPSPVVALNRAIAIAQHEGPHRGLEEIHAIADLDRLAKYPFYHAALAEFEFRSGRNEIAREHFRKALALARSSMERRFLDQRVGACECDKCVHFLASEPGPRRCNLTIGVAAEAGPYRSSNLLSIRSGYERNPQLAPSDIPDSGRWRCVVGVGVCRTGTSQSTSEIESWSINDRRGLDGLATDLFRADTSSLHQLPYGNELPSAGR